MTMPVRLVEARGGSRVHASVPFPAGVLVLRDEVPDAAAKFQAARLIRTVIGDRLEVAAKKDSEAFWRMFKLGDTMVKAVVMPEVYDAAGQLIDSTAVKIARALNEKHRSTERIRKTQPQPQENHALRAVCERVLEQIKAKNAAACADIVSMAKAMPGDARAVAFVSALIECAAKSNSTGVLKELFESNGLKRHALVMEKLAPPKEDASSKKEMEKNE